MEPNRIVVTHALSLTQPWATLVAIGAKELETRSWQTHFRGWLAIHAAKGFPRDCEELCADEPFRSALRDVGYRNTKELPRGQVIAVARLTGCYSTGSAVEIISERERAFGDYSPRRYAFALEEVRRLREPFDCRGMLNIWRLPRELTEVDLEARPHG